MKLSSLFILLLCSTQIVFAQKTVKCGFTSTVEAIAQRNPEILHDIEQEKRAIAEWSRTARKTTATIQDAVIPVIFHIVVNQRQLDQIGGIEGVSKRVDSQIAVINRDYNAANADTGNIPPVFKPLLGNARISFGIAHTGPDGSSTPGYEIIVVNTDGFESTGGTGSAFGFSSAKYTASGGADAWDTDSYLNVWVINTLENGKNSNILGLAIPPAFTTGSYGLPDNERGVILNYGAFGKRSSIFEYYIKGSDQGRTLTHEFGHYFGLFHTWGDDGGLCPNNGGKDDGIADTPPEEDALYGCPNRFPYYDDCSGSGTNGVMYMNYMDYTNDLCTNMFTLIQAARMHNNTLPGNESYSLTQHPWLLDYPAGSIAANDFVIYPNPVQDRLNISFYRQPQGLNVVYIVDLAGRYITGTEVDRQGGFYSVSVGNLRAGLYLLVMDFDSGKEVRKFWVR